METVRPLSSPPIFIAFLACIVISYQTTCYAKHNHHCPPSSCGNIPNISYPFRLQTDPKYCGKKGFFVLSCENNRTVFYLPYGKYFVQEIDYCYQTVRVVDPNVVMGNCSSIPSTSLTGYDSSDLRNLLNWYYSPCFNYTKITFLECENPVNSSLYIDTAPCNISSSSSSALMQPKRHCYVFIGYLNASDLQDSCSIESMSTIQLPRKGKINISYLEIHNIMANGLVLEWDYFDFPDTEHDGMPYRCSGNPNEKGNCRTDYCNFRTLSGYSYSKKMCGKIN